MGMKRKRRRRKTKKEERIEKRKKGTNQLGLSKPHKFKRCDTSSERASA
jgi:hypothetical protein